jgi:Na+-transporting methylmalonyl-CoA/oxaloacetate decarboxylase gamma subunit
MTFDECWRIIFCYPIALIIDIVLIVLIIVIVLDKYIFRWGVSAKIIHLMGERAMKIVVLMCFLFILFIPCYFLSKNCGKIAASEKRKDGRSNTIKFVFKKDMLQQVPGEFHEANENHNLKLLIQTENRVYVFRQKPDSQNVFRTYDVSKDDVYMIIIEESK